jgi:hypothetical protein
MAAQGPRRADARDDSSLPNDACKELRRALHLVTVLMVDPEVEQPEWDTAYGELMELLNLWKPDGFED